MKTEAIIKFISRFQFGFLSYASFLICIISGFALAFVFDTTNPDYSISLMILLNKPAMFIRSIHYWSAQFFLITSIIHIVEHLLRNSELKIKTKSWSGMISIQRAAGGLAAGLCERKQQRGGRQCGAYEQRSPGG